MTDVDIDLPVDGSESLVETGPLPEGGERPSPSDRRFSDVRRQSPHAVVVHSDGIVRYVSDAAAVLFGLDSSNSLGRELMDFVHPSSRATVARRIAQLMRGEARVAVAEARLIRADGSVFVVESAAAGTVWEGRPAVEVVLWDVTERVEMQEHLEWSALHDPLTGLANRKLLERRLEELSASGERFALLCLDLDRFKPVNDDFGHGVGDQVLGIVAQRMVGSVAEQDLVARIGGDEFVVLAPGIGDHQTAVALADRLEHAVSEPMQTGAGIVQLGASVGAVLGGSRLPDTAQLLTEADRLMYEAKAAKRASRPAPPMPGPKCYEQVYEDRDSLTGLPRTGTIQAVLDRLVSDQDAFSLGLVNVVGLRHVNRDLSDAAGDQLLQEIARRIEETDLVDSAARIGGDEFAVVAVGVGRERADDWARALRARVLRERFAIGGNPIDVDVRIAHLSSSPTMSRNVLWELQGQMARDRRMP